jgi:hypothetical protein
MHAHVGISMQQCSFINSVHFFFLLDSDQGCDASILISSKPGSKQLAEKDAEDNKDLRAEGFETVMKAKALVESKCSGVVSCADILAIAARDFVHLVSAFILSFHSAFFYYYYLKLLLNFS